MVSAILFVAVSMLFSLSRSSCARRGSGVPFVVYLQRYVLPPTGPEDGGESPPPPGDARRSTLRAALGYPEAVVPSTASRLVRARVPPRHSARAAIH